MKHIFLNLKRFDIPREYGGVNGVAPMEEWGSYIVQRMWSSSCISRKPILFRQ